MLKPIAQLSNEARLPETANSMHSGRDAFEAKKVNAHWITLLNISKR